MKKICLCLSVLLLVSALAGCNKKDISEPIDPNMHNLPHFSDPNPTTAPTIDEFVTPEDPVTPPPTLDPVTRLSALQWQTLPEFMSLGEGRVLACHNDYDEEKGIICYLDVLDVYDDAILVQKHINSPRELVQQQFLDGHFVLRDPSDHSMYLYDQDLQLIDKISTPNSYGFFSQDRTSYYFLEDNVLCRMDVSTGSSERMTLEYDLRLESLTGVHPYWDIVVARFYRSFYDDSYGICAINCATGEFLILNENADHLWFDGQVFYAASTNEHSYGVDIGFGNLFGAMEHSVTAPALGGDAVSYTMLSGSGILLLRTTADDNLSTTVYDLDDQGISSRLAQYDYNTSTLGAVYLRQEQLIFGVYPQEEVFSPVVIDPKALNYEKSLSVNKEHWPALVDRTVILNYQSEVAGPELPESLSPLRQQADALEKKYQVKILLENQAQALCGDTAQVQADAELISKALTTLDQALALYPRQFLGQFQNSIGEGGIYFCLTGTIQGDLNPVGKTQKTRNRYELMLDIGAEGLDKTIHHELWHAIEMKVSTTSFDEDSWNALNPTGANYYGKYDSGISKYTKWTYSFSGKYCYYVDSYSRINAREDRARIMENVMATDAAQLMQSPYLQKKLQFMSDVLRIHFDTTDWETPHWEQYL